MGNTHAFSTRLPALTAAGLATAAITLTTLAGTTCDFLQVTAKEDQLLLQTDDIQLLVQEVSLGIICEDPFFEREGDQMWELSWYFLLASLGMGSLATALAWAESLFLPPTRCNWKFLSTLAAVTAVVQVPVFLIFESEPCSQFDESQSCQLALGSYLIIASTIFWISLTLWTQCKDPPIWALEMSMWKTEQQYQARLAALEHDGEQKRPRKHTGNENDEDMAFSRLQQQDQRERASPWQRMFGTTTHHPDVDHKDTQSTEETGKMVPMTKLGAYYDDSVSDGASSGRQVFRNKSVNGGNSFNFSSFENTVERAEEEEILFVPATPPREQGILRSSHRGQAVKTTPQRSQQRTVRIVETPTDTPPRGEMVYFEPSVGSGANEQVLSVNQGPVHSSLTPMGCFAPSLMDQDDSQMMKEIVQQLSKDTTHTRLEKTPLYQQPMMGCSPTSEDILQDLEAENKAMVESERKNHQTKLAAVPTTSRSANKAESDLSQSKSQTERKADPPGQQIKEEQPKKVPTTDRLGANIRSFTNRVKRDSQIMLGRRSNNPSYGYAAMDDDSFNSGAFPSTPPIEVKIDLNAETPKMGDDEGFPTDWVKFNEFPTAAAQFAISADAQEKANNNANIRIVPKNGDEDESQPAAFYHSDPEPDIYSSDDSDDDDDDQGIQRKRLQVKRYTYASDNSTLSSKSSVSTPGRPPLPRKHTPSSARSTRSASSLMETPIEEETATDIIKENEGEARMAAYALSKLNLPATTGRGRDFDRRAQSGHGRRSFSPSDRVSSTPMQPRNLEPSLSSVSSSSVNRKREDEEKKDEDIDDFILNRGVGSPRSPNIYRSRENGQYQPDTNRGSPVSPSSPNIYRSRENPKPYRPDTNIIQSAQKAPRTPPSPYSALSAEKNLTGDFDARPTHGSPGSRSSPNTYQSRESQKQARSNIYTRTAERDSITPSSPYQTASSTKERNVMWGINAPSPSRSPSSPLSYRSHGSQYQSRPNLDIPKIEHVPSTSPRSYKALSLNEERNVIGGINARPKPVPVESTSYISDDSQSEDSGNMSMEARRARMNRLRQKISADADKSSISSRARKVRMARVRGHNLDDDTSTGTPTRSNRGQVTPQKPFAQRESKSPAYGKSEGTPATAPNESFESQPSFDGISQGGSSIQGFLAEAGAALDSLGMRDVKSPSTEISRGVYNFTPSEANTGDLDDLDLQLIHTRRPLYAEYGDEEASL